MGLLPKRIILVRHGESIGNLDTSAYCTIPDYRIPLTDLGQDQARAAGARIRSLVSASKNWKVFFYVSPYERTRSTLREIGRSFPRGRIAGVREECRIREQDFGNFQAEDRMRLSKEARARFGRFFFRFPEGESAADVFDRVASFMETLWRDINMKRFSHDEDCEMNVVIVSHGLTSRVFMMKWFKWTVEQFECLYNPENAEVRIMELGPCGTDYSLAVNHSPEELHQWGLSPEMIAEQQRRAAVSRVTWSEDPHSFSEFFDSLAEEEDADPGQT